MMCAVPRFAILPIPASGRSSLVWRARAPFWCCLLPFCQALAEAEALTPCLAWFPFCPVLSSFDPSAKVIGNWKHIAEENWTRIVTAMRLDELNPSFSHSSTRMSTSGRPVETGTPAAVMEMANRIEAAMETARRLARDDRFLVVPQYYFAQVCMVVVVPVRCPCACVLFPRGCHLVEALNVAPLSLLW